MGVTEEDTVITEEGYKQHYDVLIERGDCYATIGEYERAQQCYGKAAALAPDEPGPYIGLGAVSLQKGLLEDAEVAFKVACRLDNNCARAYCGLAMVYQQRMDFTQACQMYSRCLELDGDNLIALLGLFQSSCQMGAFSKIMHYMEVYLDMRPGDTAIMFCLATLYMNDGQFSKAKKVLSNVLILDPANRNAANLLEEVEHEFAQINITAATTV